MKGRMQCSEEYIKAARFVAVQFKNFGLKPFNGDSMLRYFNDEYNQIKRARMAMLNDDGYEVKVFKLGEDFVCRGFTGSGNVKGEVVFCGYGLRTAEYNDYQSIDVKNKIVMVFKTIPKWNRENGWGDTSPRAKARIAEELGASAILFINQPDELPQRILAGSVACGDKPHLPDFPMLQIGNHVASLLFEKLGQEIHQLYSEINDKHAPYSVELGSYLRINVEAEYYPEKPTINVIGLLEGKDKKLKNEYIVVGAHLDHVGQQTDRLIFPGANDNASGVASIIEIAKAIQISGYTLKRSILFVAFSSEESGLRGSKNFIDFPPVPLDQIKIMLNFDCVGQGDSIAIGGKLSFPKLWQVAAGLDKKHTKLLSNKTFGGGGADAEAFYREGIPTLYFNTSGGYKYLHLESDKTETFNKSMYEKLTQLGFLTIIELANGKYKGEKDLLKMN